MRALAGWLVLALVAWGSANAAQASKNGVGPNAISVPSGPGSIEGLGESFEPSLNSGTGGYGLSIALPGGSPGPTPSLGLTYEGGKGNGILGFGWGLSEQYLQRLVSTVGSRLVDGCLAQTVHD